MGEERVGSSLLYTEQQTVFTSIGNMLTHRE